MARFKHLVVPHTGTPSHYTSTSGGGSLREYRYPARNPADHATKLREDLEQVNAEIAKQATGLHIKKLVLEFFGANGAGLESDSLNDEQAKIELLSVREEAGITYATVFVPEEGIAKFLKKIDDYEKKLTEKGKPENQPLMESLQGIRLPVLRSFWTDDDSKFPVDQNAPFWWEVWLRRSASNGPHTEWIPDSFRSDAQRAGLRILPGVSVFPERIAFLVHGTAAQWARSFNLLFSLAELRRAAEIPADLARFAPRDQKDWVNAAVNRIAPPPINAPAVCVVDTGCQNRHPLLHPALSDTDCLCFDPSWRRDDVDGHGTEMAGLALYGSNLAELLSGSHSVVLSHRLESVKFRNDAFPHDPENFGHVTTESVSLAAQTNPNRARVICMMTTAGNTKGQEPQLWSATLDQHAAGALDGYRTLYVVPVGNIRKYLTEPYAYPECNQTMYGVEDPAQAYNVLSVGGYTERVTLSPEFNGRECIAPVGGLSPISRTSMMWDRDDWSVWPYKPDVVMEAGNYLQDKDGRPEACHDLHLLTTCMKPGGLLLTTAGDTSAATAQAAKLAAEIMADYPSLWPETIRGLIVHSAKWTPAMMSEFPETSQTQVRRRLRCYGYGVPSAERARFTLNNQVSLIVQDSLQPFRKDSEGVKTNEYKLHALPWPASVLEQLSVDDVTVKITLSYYIEPSPGRRGFSTKFRYASHGLHFAVRGATEGNSAFEKRISKASWTEEERKKNSERTVDRPDTGDPVKWSIGTQVRTRGSIHCDWWTASAADIARSGAIAVYPVTGWWKERPNQNRYHHRARYALIVTLSTPDASVDLYTPIAQQIAATVPIST